ncbi:MAG: hypothetical protein V4655_08635 [Bdellovibrionota bacterium]
MSGFLDHLFDPKSSGKLGREKIRYRENLRSLIHDAPAVRRLITPEPPYIIHAHPAHVNLPMNTELLIERVGETASADRFREWKTIHSSLPIWRLDPVGTEEQVLETRAMGADAFALDVGGQDLPMLQFLLEVGRDYGLPAVLSCQTPEDLALALKVQDGGIIWLRDELATEGLFDLESLRGRQVLFEGLEPLTFDSNWVCGVVQLYAEIPLPPKREPRPTPKNVEAEVDEDFIDDEPNGDER